MNKSNILLVLLLYLAITSCARLDTPAVPEDPAIPPITSTFVTKEMAISEVEEFLKIFDAGTKSGGRTIAEIYPSGNMPSTRSDVSDVEISEPFVYIVNFSNDEGFAIVSGDTRMSPILACADNGNIERGEIIENPGLIAMLGNIDVEYRLAVGLPVLNDEGTYDWPIGITDDGTYVYPKTSNSGAFTGFDNDPRTDGSGDYHIPEYTYSYTEWNESELRGTPLGCQWGQSYDPYNRFTYTSDGKKAPAGCVATAVAQIMYFWGKDFNMDGYDFDWEIMRKHKSIFNPYPAAYDMIGELFLKLGLPKNLDMDYGEHESGAFSENVPKTFQNCGYASGGQIEDYDSYKLYSLISTGPAYVAGYAKRTVTKFLGIKVKTEYSDGHAWVIDQVLDQNRIKTTYKDGELYKQEEESRRLVYCNFGWNGSCDGYYYTSIFNADDGPVETRSADSPKGDNSYYYHYKLRMNTGIRI